MHTEANVFDIMNMNALLRWGGRQWIVVITDGKQTIEMPLDVFRATPVVKGLIADALAQRKLPADKLS